MSSSNNFGAQLFKSSRELLVLIQKLDGTCPKTFLDLETLSLGMKRNPQSTHRLNISFIPAVGLRFGRS
jgi:hypothetical protein